MVVSNLWVECTVGSEATFSGMKQTIHTMALKNRKEVEVHRMMAAVPFRNLAPSEYGCGL